MSVCEKCDGSGMAGTSGPYCDGCGGTGLAELEARCAAADGRTVVPFLWLVSRAVPYSGPSAKRPPPWKYVVLASSEEDARATIARTHPPSVDCGEVSVVPWPKTRAFFVDAGNPHWPPADPARDPLRVLLERLRPVLEAAVVVGDWGTGGPRVADEAVVTLDVALEEIIPKSCTDDDRWPKLEELLDSVMGAPLLSEQVALADENERLRARLADVADRLEETLNASVRRGDCASTADRDAVQAARFEIERTPR